MKSDIRSTYSVSAVADAVAALLKTVALRTLDMPDTLRLETGGRNVVVTLGGFEDCRRWDVSVQALGFHAVSTGTRYDVDEVGEAMGEPWFDVNEEHEVVLNVEMAVTLCIEHSMNPDSVLEDIDFMTSLIATPIHELLHLEDWLLSSAGRTPLEVFDQDDGEWTLLRMARAAEDSEDDVESEALAIAERLVADDQEIGRQIEEVLELLPRRSQSVDVPA